MKKSLILSSLFAFNAFALSITDARKIEISLSGKIGTGKLLMRQCADELGRSFINKSFNSTFSILNSRLVQNLYRDGSLYATEYEGISENGEKQMTTKFHVNFGVFQTQGKQITVKCNLASTYFSVRGDGDCNKFVYVNFDENYPLNKTFLPQSIIAAEECNSYYNAN